MKNQIVHGRIHTQIFYSLLFRSPKNNPTHGYAERSN